MIKYYWAFFFSVALLNCSDSTKDSLNSDPEQNSTELALNSSNQDLVEAFNWAKEKI